MLLAHGCVGDECAIPSLCNLALDNSMDMAPRLAAVALVAAAVSCGSEDCKELAVSKGAFEALVILMDSDHRQVRPSWQAVTIGR